ncbi:anthranilate synthase component I family protein [Sediminibacterium sp.]|uniref:anthranilate synthase component I family protein n=1 Tax=Sediminibacterium sp. TaxID=1917865 RepID=UPI0025DF4173|nr:anthranilate synthase component I family protein [Sediminibacterium sp.]MBW0178819.1 anthranilate synthase component I family protein [Sediminibacterium sp.]
MLSWVNRFNICSFLDNHLYQSGNTNLECLAACGSIAQTTDNPKFAELDAFLQQQKGNWIFGHIGYDNKNQVETLSSIHPDAIQFPDLFFFVPAVVLKLQYDKLEISCYDQSNPEEIYREIISVLPVEPAKTSSLKIESRLSRNEYIQIIQQLKQHILRGDCYEINYCQEFYATDIQIDPVSLYQQLTAISPNPFACYYKHESRHLLCASPERFLQKKGSRLISQPIKGTIQRNLLNQEADTLLLEELKASEKDKSENVMVVDLVRNDLSKVCKEGSVKVSELFGIYSFPQVHQMISTIEGELDENVPFSSILKACFPMGSMTGAPKKRVMELIEQYEKTKRGLYSGAVGYIDPNGDFDFNVVIRSILYNAANQYLGYQVGGGITFYSDPEKEYEECLLKAAAIRKVLQVE